ncbi:MAG: V-type ATP synthase subunit E [Ruminococcus sp.]|nr:V-type ATP synthase subunit E [Ruminococcus sp.]
MSGLDEIINIISTQQKENEDRLMSSAASKVSAINKQAAADAEKAYSDYIKKAAESAARDYENSCNSVDAAMKRRILEFKVAQIDRAIDNTVKKLVSLPAEEYFSMLTRLITSKLRSGEGTVWLGSRDLARQPSDFAENISRAAAEAGCTVRISGKPADIPDGFVLQYGNISENCSFRAVLEAERDAVRDTAARELFR